MTVHDEIAELLGVYALDAVDADEAVEIESHLAECPRCRDEVAHHREVAASLAFVGATAPEGLWTRISSSLEASSPPAELARLYPLHRPRRSLSLRVALAAASAAAALVIALGWQVHDQGRQLAAVRRQVLPSALDHAVQGALLNPYATKVHLASSNGQTSVDAVLVPDGTGYLARNDLPGLAADRTYQLWGVVGNEKVSLGVLGPHPGIVPFRASAAIQALAITDEQAGGVVASRQSPVAVGYLTPAFVPVS